MDDYEVLRETKVCYEYMIDLLENCDYISDKYRNHLIKAMDILGNIYSDCYKVASNNSREELKTDLDCPHCKNKVDISDLIDYVYVCNDCDENFYSFEGDLNNKWYFDGKTEKSEGSIEI